MKEITTNGITILLVEVPEDAKEFQIRTSSIGDLFYKTNQNDIGYGKATLPIGQYQILGKSTELSEEQMNEIVESFKYVNINYFLDYIKKGNYYTSVQESYLSLLEANGIVDRNEYGIDCPEYEAVCCGNYVSSQFDMNTPSCCMIPIASEESRQLVDLWQEAQSKVKHYLVLKRI